MADPGSKHQRSSIPDGAPSFRGTSRWLLGGWLAFSAVILVWAALLAIQTIHIPFPGLFTEPTLVVNNIGLMSWSGYAAGLRLPEQLVALNGKPLEHPGALIEALRTHQVGEMVTFTARHAETGALRQVKVRLMPFPRLALWDFFLIPYALGLFYLSAGGWMLWRQGQAEAGQVFTLFCTFIALMSGLFLDVYTTHRLFPLWVAAIPLVGSAAIHLALVFPRPATALQRFPWLRLGVYLPALGLAVAGWLTTADMAHPIAYFVPWRWGRAWAGIGGLVLIGMMVYHRLRSRSPIIRAQTYIVLLGTLLSFLPMMVWIPLAFRPGFPFQPALLLPPFIFFPLSVAYAILFPRTLNIDWVVRSAVVYVLLTLVLVGTFALLLGLLGRWLHVPALSIPPVVLAVLVLIVVVGTGPLRDGLIRGVDRLLGRKVAPERALRAFGTETATARTADEVIATAARTIGEVLAPRFVLWYMQDPRSGIYVPRALSGTPPLSPPPFRPDGPLARRMTSDLRLLYLSVDDVLPPGLEEEEERLAALGPTLFVPLPGWGWLVIGPTLLERFRARDAWFLETLAPQVTAALERVRLISDLERRVQELEVVGTIAQSVSFSVQPDDLMELIYTQVNRVLEARNFYIALYDPETRTLRFTFYVENGERRYPEDVWPDTEGLTGLIVRTGQPIVTDDYLTECERRGVRPGGRPGRAWMGMPLVSRDRILGVMTVSSFDPDGVYTPEQVRVFQVIADQVAAILDKVRLYQETEKWARRLEGLNEMGRLLASTLDLNCLLDMTVRKAVDLLQAEAGALLLVDEETGDLVPRVTVGLSEPAGARLLAGADIARQAVRENRPIRVASPRREEYREGDHRPLSAAHSWLCVPLTAPGAAIGALEMMNRRDGRPFDEDDERLLTAFSAQAAIAIQNARLFAMTDQALAARIEELSMMQRIDRELNATLDYEQTMKAALEWAIRRTGADIGLIAVLAEEDGRQGLRLLVHHGYPPEWIEQYRNTLWPLDRGIVGRVARTGQPELIADVRHDSEYTAIVEGMVAQMTVPIRREERLIGIIVLETARADQFGPEALDFVVRLADHAAIAIENARLFAAVEAANQAKTDFISFVSHELKQPMTAIKGYTDLLVKGLAGELTETQRSFLEVIRANVNRMDTMVQELLDVSRIEAGRLRLEIGQVALREAIEEAVRAIRQEIEARRQTLEVEIAEPLPPVMADRNRVVQILTNLLSNAYKYTPEEGHIWITAWRDKGFVVCSVSDTGIGIPPEDQERLFTKFFRSQHPMVRSVPGTGLGLVIARSLVELQGGRIWVESEPGKGSTFTFTLPIAGVADDSNRASDQAI
ncbi:MAG: GAF domain-containing protein [Anaerolineae bacterium]|nr:GAF domain-containing protein [Anaerolineae bacterium]MDW8069383.1 GAF domain-containing protein [Anaerolineae bacterium]